jgi:hypothetical protein
MHHYDVIIGDSEVYKLLQVQQELARKRKFLKTKICMKTNLNQLGTSLEIIEFERI